MHVNDPSILELDQLMLPAADDARDQSAAEGEKPPGRHPPLQRRVMEDDTIDGAAYRDASQASGGAVDFRKLGHRECCGRD
jgi:hypothetical protein